MPKITLILSEPSVLPRNVEMDADRITLGRSRSCTIPIEDRFLSRTHVELVARDGKWFARDCGSANGTFVNGTQIDREVEVRFGDSIRIGDSHIRFSGTSPHDEITQVGVEPAHEPPPATVPEAEPVPEIVLEEGQVKESTERTMLIHRLALELIGDRSMTELFEIIVQHVMEDLAPSRVAIALLGDDGESLEIVGVRGNDEAADQKLTISKTLLRQIIKERKVLSYTDVTSDEALATAESVLSQGIVSALCAPLLVEGRVLGVLYLDHQLSKKVITEDDAHLAAQIATVAAIKLESTRLRAAAIEKERLDEALRLARAIQMRMLPQAIPARREDSLYDIDALIRPARQVGGDFYDFFQTEDDRLYICIGDVSGKGIPAALLMAVTRALFRSMVMDGGRPAAIMTAVNRQLAQESDPEIFVTAFCGVLDLATGELSFSNGGHTPAFLITGRGDVTQLPMKPGMVLGFMEGNEFAEQTYTLAPGDALYLDTDGVVEARNEAEEFFSTERLLSILKQKATEPVGEIVSSVLASVEEFVGDAPQSDDLTLMAMRYLKKAERG